jgi:Tol biopolymer transport system component
VSGADGQGESIVVPASNGVHVHQPAWSADGSSLYYLRSIEIAGKPPTEIWRIPATGGTPQPVVTGHSAQMPRAAPDGRSLLYAWSATGDRLGLWRLPLGGGAHVRVTTGAGEYVEPTISRDGRRMAVTARRVDSSLAAVATDRPDSEVTVPVTAALSGDTEPAVAATGQIVFTTSRNGVPSLWTLLPGDPEPRPLTSGTDLDAGPAMSPDGSQVAFVSYRGGHRGIWTVPAAGGAPRQVTAADVLDRVSWSPDGSRLVFAAAIDDVPWLWTVAATGGVPVRIAGAEGRTPAWCPVRDVIAFRAKDGLLLIDGTGKNVRPGPLPKVPVEFTSLAWSHDGRRLAMGTAAAFPYPALWILDLDSEPRYTRVLTSSRYYRIDGIAWRPDDRSIVFGRTQYDSQVLVLEAASESRRR